MSREVGNFLPSLFAEHRWLWGSIVTVMVSGCGAGGKPVDIFPEDACSNCRMAISNHRFAAEIISDAGEVFKFDDIGCMVLFRATHDEVKIAAMYVKDYGTKEWAVCEQAVVLETDTNTPMGSGMVAFSDSSGALEFQKQHPPNSKEAAWISK